MKCSFRRCAVLKLPLPLATLLAISTAAAVQATPSCYMESNGRIIDLSHMCGDSTSSPPPALPRVVSPEPQSIEQPPAATPVAEDPVTFQVTRTQYDIDTNRTTITGLVVFPRTAEYGERVRPSVYDKRDNTLVTYMPLTTRVRGQRRITVSTDVWGRHFLRDLEGQI